MPWKRALLQEKQCTHSLFVDDLEAIQYTVCPYSSASNSGKLHGPLNTGLLPYKYLLIPFYLCLVAAVVKIR